jgi:hypothetical protein
MAMVKRRHFLVLPKQTKADIYVEKPVHTLSLSHCLLGVSSICFGNKHYHLFSGSWIDSVDRILILKEIREWNVEDMLKKAEGV